MQSTMRAMVFEKPKTPLRLLNVPIPAIGPGQVLLKNEACGVCRTDLHIVDADLTHPKLPLILGHQIVGRVVQVAEGCTRFKVGDRVGVPWLGKSCGHCSYCQAGKENLCDNGLYMGYQLDGGYAEYTAAYEEFIFAIPDKYTAVEACPLLCAGLIGFRTLKLSGSAQKLGFYGFGAAASLLAQVAVYQGKSVYAFVKPGDEKGKAFAKQLGAVWAGGSDEPSPVPLDAALIFAPAGELVPEGLKNIKKGGCIVCAGIHMSNIPEFPYSLLYGEKTLQSVTNLTRVDGQEFFEIVKDADIKTYVTTYPLEEANQALDDFRAGKLKGSAVLVI
ncbi:MAG: zinc-dependent alcohol dehydrogenase family protein [Chlamydiales bacterium]|nr:zinc-dependent alcohol dehydrogenase family protein [Chlamydiales bacterium]